MGRSPALLLITLLSLADCREPIRHESALLPPPSRLTETTAKTASELDQINGLDLVSFHDGFALIAERVGPAVVNVSSTRIVHSHPRDQVPFFSDPLFREFFGGPLARPPRELKQQSLGSGVLISKDGYVLTNNHVIQGASDVRVALQDRRELKATIVGTDPKTDIALLRIPGADFPFASMGDSSKVRVGEFAIAFGDPLGLGQTMTAGIISAKGRGNVGLVDYEDFLQTDAAINPGNSGGPLVNVHGELIGINTAIATSGGGRGNQGIGFAVPSNLASEVVRQIEQHGHVIRGWLGVTVQDVTPTVASALGLKTVAGALVSEVHEASPASKAGLLRGDIVLEINGKPVADSRALRMVVAETPPGTRVKLSVLRGDKRLDLAVPLGEMPAEEKPGAITSPGSSAALGLQVAPLTPDLQGKLNLPPGTTGVVIVAVQPGSRAAEAGLQAGDLIQEIDRVAVRTPSDLKRVLDQDPQRAHLLLVRHQGETRYIGIPAEER